MRSRSSVRHADNDLPHGIETLTIWQHPRYAHNVAQFATTRPKRAARGFRRADFHSRLDSLGLKAPDSASLIRQVEKGFSFATLRNLESRSGIAISKIASIVGIPERTLARRKSSGKLTWDESERLLRISSVFEKAVDLFEGDVAAASSWLMTPRKALGNRTPLAYSRTEVGAGEVQNLIGRLEHGIFS
jgi:putative toxin-antitoxin system antitoxin component (TIGR02293 family)